MKTRIPAALALAALLGACAPGFKLSRPADSIGVCYVENEQADSLSRALLAQAIDSAAAFPGTIRLSRSCEAAPERPTLFLRPLLARHPTTAGYALLPAMSAGSLALTYGFWQIGWIVPPFLLASPVSGMAFEAWMDSAWAEERYRLDKVEYASYFGGEARRSREVRQGMTRRILEYANSERRKKK